MSDFWSKLKNCLIEQIDENHKFDACGYYETLHQNADKLQPIINDCEKAHSYSMFYEKDKTDGYTEGTITIQLINNAENMLGATHLYPYYYIIELDHDERYWGYCECTPNQEDYNFEYNCRGINCDWVAPSINIIKVEYLTSFSFNGYQKDMWALREKWKEILKEANMKKLEEELQLVEQAIEKYNQKKKKLLEKVTTYCL